MVEWDFTEGQYRVAEEIVDEGHRTLTTSQRSGNMNADLLRSLSSSSVKAPGNRGPRSASVMLFVVNPSDEAR